MLRSSVFQIKDIRNLDLSDGTEENPQEHCHTKRRTLMSPQESKINWCTPNQLKMKHISPSLNPYPSRIPHHIQQVAWHTLQQSRDSVRHPSQFYKNINFSKKQDERSRHPISSRDESWFPVFDWRGKPSFHKHLKRSFPLGICMWEGPCVFCFKRNGPRDALIR